LVIGRKNTVHGAYNISLQNERDRIAEEMKKLGIVVSQLESDAIIVERSKNILMSPVEAKELIRRLRGV
jgi:hypothetical protein